MQFERTFTVFSFGEGATLPDDISSLGRPNLLPGHHAVRRDGHNVLFSLNREAVERAAACLEFCQPFSTEGLRSDRFELRPLPPAIDGRVAAYDQGEFTVALTGRFVAALRELARAEMEMMRANDPAFAGCWTWAKVTVEDLSTSSGIRFEFGGDDPGDRPEDWPEGEPRDVWVEVAPPPPPRVGAGEETPNAA